MTSPRPPRRFARPTRPYLRLISTLMAGAFALSLAAAAPIARDFNLPADGAERSLKLFSAQSGLEVVFPSDITRNGRGTVSLWVKSSNAGSAAAVKLRIDDIDGTEETPGLTINSDGQWHRYTWDMETFNGTTVDTGNGFINTDATVTIDSIIFSQPNTAGTWTMYIDDFLHDREELNPGLVNIATSATLSACSFKTTSSNTYSVDKAVDRDRTSPASRWVSGADAEPHWFQLDWPSSRKINRVKVWSGSPSSPEHQIDDYKIQYWTGSAWSDVATVASNNRDSF